MNSASRRFRLTVYDLESGQTDLPIDDDRVFFVYVKDGSARIATDGGDRALGPDDGGFAKGSVIAAPDSQAWLFEASPVDERALDVEIVASHPANLGLAGPFLIRADRIESRHGARTPRHGHRGPGIRRLIKGTLRAEMGDTVRRIQAGDAWFEPGDEPVVGENYGGTNAAFVRFLVLPADLAGGKSSFVATDEAEAQKPRSVDQRLFGEIV